MPRPGALLRRLARPALVAAFLLAPAAATSLALAVTARATLADCVPLWSDEVHYWNEIACFARAGFGGGYCVPDERPAPASWCHFGPHGPGFPAVCGSLARLLGWHPASGPLFNVLFLMAGAAAWLALCRPDTTRLALATLLAATYWPLLLYLPATMQEGLHCGIAFLLAGLAHAGINREGARAWWLVPFCLVAVAAALVRVTWVLVLVPCACVALGRLSWPRRLALVAAAAAAVPCLAWQWRTQCAPFPGFLSDVIATAKTSPSAAAADLAGHFRYSLQLFFDRAWGTTPQVWLRYEAAGVALVGAWFVLRPRAPDRRALVFAGLNVALVAAAVIAVYDVVDWRDHRVIAPHLLLSLLVLLSGGAYRGAAAIVAVHLLFAVPFLEQFAAVHRDRPHVPAAEIAATRSAVEGVLAFDPAEPAWANTVLVPAEYLATPLLGVPAGVGVSYYALHGASLELPPKSRYLILGPRDRQDLGDRVRLVRLRRLPAGVLYLNLDSFPDGRAPPPAAPEPPEEAPATPPRGPRP
jgi:hypothetical protein